MIIKNGSVPVAYDSLTDPVSLMGSGGMLPETSCDMGKSHVSFESGVTKWIGALFCSKSRSSHFAKDVQWV